MTAGNLKPIIFLAFANEQEDRNRYLRKLGKEVQQLQEILEEAEWNGLCELAIGPNATIDRILDVFRRHRDRIAVFHFGGHADSYHLLLESSESKTGLAHAGGLAAFLGQQTGLQLVFLNGCSTRRQVNDLLEAGVSSVIATSRAIDDQTATDFAIQFYRSLASGAGLRRAYLEAEAAVQIAKGGTPRHLYRAEVAMEDRFPWELYPRELPQVTAQWSLPDTVGNPLWGLPPLPDQDLPESPFRHLRWFGREHAEVFFGRGHQIRDLCQRATAQRGAPIILFYGQSGVGKSSLLAAGLLPRLEANHETRYVRRDQEKGMLGILKEALHPPAASGRTSEVSEAWEICDPAQTWLTLETRLDKPLLVILDQVEEVYTRPQADPAREWGECLEALETIFADPSRRPRGKLILGFRKDWLAEIKKQLEAHRLYHCEVFLERLDRRGIMEAVAGPARLERLRMHYGLTVAEELPGIIADDLLQDPDSPVAPTLQILLTKMWDQAKQQNRTRPCFGLELYQELRREGLLLSDFLDQQLKALRDWRADAVDSGLALDVLVYHTTPMGTAEQRTEEQLKHVYSHQLDVLPNLVQKCKDLFLLVDSMHRQGTESVGSRLIHDALAPLVRVRFDESDRPGQRARRILEYRSLEWMDSREGPPLSSEDLAVVEHGLAGMRVWTPDEERLVKASRREKERKARERLIELEDNAHRAQETKAYLQATIYRADALKLCRQPNQFRLRAVLLNRLGQVMQADGRIQHSVIAYEAAVQVLDGGEDAPMREDYVLGIEYDGNGRQQIARDLEQEEADPALMVKLLMNIGNAYLVQLQVGPALNAYERALRQPEIDQIPELRAQFLTSLGLIRRREGVLDVAVSLLEEALELWERRAGAPEKRHTLALLAGIYRDQGLVADARRLYDQALELCEQVEDALGQGRTYAGLGHLHLEQDRISDAEEAFRLAVDLATDVDDTETLWHAYWGLGRVCYFTGALESAAMYFRRSLDMVGTRSEELQTYEGKLTSIDTVQGIFDQLITVDLALGKVQDAMAYVNGWIAQLFRRGQPTRAIEYAIQAYDLAREHLDEQDSTYRTSLSNLAALYHSVGNYGAAKPLFEEVLRVERQVLGEQDPQVAATLNNLAVLHTEIGDYAGAELFYQQALEIRRAGLGERDLAVAHTLSDLANLYRVLGKYSQAESHLTEAIEIHHYLGGEESLDLARSLNALGVLNMTTGSYAKAKPQLEESLEIRRAKLGEAHPDVAESLNNLAYLHQEQRNYSEATSLYQKARDIDRQVFGADHVRYAEDLNNLALVHYHIGNYAAARQLFEQALHIWQNAFKEEAHPQVARGLNNLAEVHLAMGDYRAAERLADQAAQIRRIVLGEENPNYAVSLTTLAKVHELTGNYTRAESLYEQARDIRKASQGENHPDFAESLNNLAALYHSMGKHKEAEVLWLQASDIWRRVSGEESTYFATSLNNLGALYREMGRYEEAERSYWQAYEIWHRIYGEEHILVATTLNNLGELYRDLGEYPEAEQLYTRARDTWQKVFGEDHPDYALCQNNLALLVAAAGQNDRALALMTEAAASDDRMIMQVFSISSESHRMAYISLLKGHLDTLLSLVMQSRADSSEGVGIALDLVLRRKAIVAEAFAVQRDAILGDRYPELEAELAKLTTLRGEIARNTLDGPGPEGVDAFKQLLVERHAQREQLEAELAQQIPEMELERKLRAADRAAIAEALPPGAALVEFVRFNVFDFAAVPAQGDARWKPARYAAFVLHAGKPNDAEMIDLGEARFIDEKVAAFRTSITGEVEPGSARGASDPSFLPDQVSVRSDQAVLGSVIAAATRHLRVESRPYEPAERTKLGVALRQMVFDQLKSALNGCTQLFLAPDSNLTRLPFEVLPLEEDRYLIDASYQFSYLSVGRDVLRFGPGFTGHSTSPMVTADPDYDLGADNVSGFSAGKPFRRLGGTCQEGKEVAALLGVEPALEQQALESKLKACRSPSILHVATHGFFLPDASYNLDKEVLADSRWAQLAQMQNPLLRSGLALAGANTWLQQGRLPAEAEDGLLTAEDVTGMDLLSTELAVLSACETGLGEVQDGEGVFGLRRAFLLAGAKTLVMSLWKVPDQQTQELMVDFYQRILQGQPRAKALRQAQLAMKARHPDPFYWGAFICQGDPGSLLGTYRWERNGRGTC